MSVQAVASVRSQLRGYSTAYGESGRGARPTDPQWVRTLRDDCKDMQIAFHFKQWGHWAPSVPEGISARQQIELQSHSDHRSVLYAIGKAAAGRILDGRTWDEMPS